MYTVRDLTQAGFADLADTFNLAFADYVTPMQTTPGQLLSYFRVAAVDLRHSFGAFYGDELVGVLVNGVDACGGGTVAYDAVTGIVKEHRGKGLFSALFQRAGHSLKSSGISRYCLEVITANENACAVYRRKGGRVERELAFLTGGGKEVGPAAGVALSPLSAFVEGELCRYRPSFANRLAALRRDMGEYLVARCGDVAVVLSKRGRISQIRYSGPADTDALCAVLAHLSRQFGVLSISNIPVAEEALMGALLTMGFTVKVHQYEMSMEL